MDDASFDLPPRPPRVDGVYRRRYRLAAVHGRVVAELEDDFHAFAVTLDHDGRRVTAVSGEARRVPWTTCPGAIEPLRGLVGATLERDVDAVARSTDPHVHCTHWLDLACLAVAHAARGETRRVYDVAVGEPRGRPRRAEIRADGEERLAWTVDEIVVRSEGPFRHVRLVGEPFRRALAALADEGLREAAWVLRKGVMTSFSRLYDMDRVTRPEAFGAGIRAACHSFQGGVVERTARVVGATRDFTDDADALLRDDD